MYIYLITSVLFLLIRCDSFRADHTLFSALMPLARLPFSFFPLALISVLRDPRDDRKHMGFLK
jgi:hypothetical protein